MYDLTDSALVKCLMLPPNSLGPDESGVSINETLFRGMIGSLMYLTASEHDIQFFTCLCARYQANPNESHLVAVKRISRYLKGTPNLGLCYLKGSGFNLKAYSDLDYAGSEAEYKVAAGCYAQVLWIKSQLADYDVLYEKVPIFFDNTSVIAISNHLVLHSQDQSKRHTSVSRPEFRSHPKDGRGSNKFTPLTRTPKEIFAAESGKFKPPPPMMTPVEKRNSNKLCEFHNDKGYITDEYVQLKKQIEELVRAGKLSHFIKEIRQNKDQQKTGKKDAPAKDKAASIYMIQPWQRVTRQKVTQSFDRVREITFPTLTVSKGIEGLLVIEAEIGGHAVHRMYVDGGSSMEWGNYMATRTTKALGDYRRRRALYESMDELYDSGVAVTVQWYHWTTEDKRDPSGTIHGSRNDQIPGK
ncbi:hypothetical protein Tco_0154648 [Tanacetum coccineum]